MIKKIWKVFLKFLKASWLIIKSMGTWRGFLSISISWLLLSGSGIALIGFIISSTKLITLGASIYAFWLLPVTPLILIEVAFAMLIQRFVFRDKNVTLESIKSKFKEAFGDNKKEDDDNELY